MSRTGADGWIGIREARARRGLRLVLLRGFPSPWSLAARALFELKRIPFARVQRADDDPPDALPEVLGLLGRRLREQRRAGRAYLVGDAPSALDVYWAASSHLFAPASDDVLPLPGALRRAIALEAEPWQEALDPALVEHRDALYRDLLTRPVEL